MPAHIARPDGYAYPAWTTNVIHRNAPGAMSAIALTVTPVKPRVGTIFFCSSAILPPSISQQRWWSAATHAVSRYGRECVSRLKQEKCHFKIQRFLVKIAMACSNGRHPLITWSSEPVQLTCGRTISIAQWLEPPVCQSVHEAERLQFHPD